MRVSVVTPSFNMKNYLRPTIESVLANLLPGDEYFIVDGGSGDGSTELMWEKTANAFTWPEESPASVAAHAEDRARWQALYFNDRIVIRMDPRNIGSWRVAEKCGCRFEGIARQVAYAKGSFDDDRHERKPRLVAVLVREDESVRRHHCRVERDGRETDLTQSPVGRSARQPEEQHRACRERARQRPGGVEIARREALSEERDLEHGEDDSAQADPGDPPLDLSAPCRPVGAPQCLRARRTGARGNAGPWRAACTRYQRRTER